jgi:hypothetical protein
MASSIDPSENPSVETSKWIRRTQLLKSDRKENEH